ncbi:hypothetical protein LOCC1_G006711 [Lachnellula occidentalis]|uniref:Uncharacterized protein n=1 Tax=Lachnellula occidentalis TaxID=215460 RepID=A0A8H8UF93_9HELO|nr:hypothetical protein LOCC1_G006711 [Lachnellula occidentalis]
MSSSTIGINPEAGTSALDRTFLETVVLHNRDYQQYSINNQVYFVPIDEASVTPEMARESFANPSTTKGGGREASDHAQCLELGVRREASVPPIDTASKNTRPWIWISILGNRGGRAE